MLALKAQVKHGKKPAEVVGRCLPGRYDQEFKYDLRYGDGSLCVNVPESELKKETKQ